MEQKLIQELSSTGHHQECLQACQNVLQGNPEEAFAYKYAGKSLLALGQFDKAQQCLVKAHQLDASDPEIAKDIGNSFLNLGNTDNALQWYGKALEINNNYAPAFNNIASLKRQSGNVQEAIDLFKRAIQVDPKLIQAYVGAAASFLALGDLDQAASFAGEALAINESTPGINEILGIIFQNKSNPDQAIECYQKELNINPKASNSLLNLGLLLLQQGKTAAAVESLVKASALAPSEQCSLLLAQAYQNLGQFKEAIVEYKKLDINQSENKLIPFNLGLCLLNTGNNIDAIEAFKIAVQLDESFIPAWGNLGNALKGEGRLKETIQATQKVLDLDPDNPDAHMNLGGIYKELENLDQALASTLKSLELKPDNPDAHMNLGGIYQELGQLDQALASTLKSLELKPDDNPTAHMNLGGIYEINNKKEQALKHYLLSAELIYSHNKGSSISGMISSVPILIQLGKTKEAKEKIIEITQMLSKITRNIVNYSVKDKKNDQAYFGYLKALLPEIPHDSSTDLVESIHIGESHCLAFTNQILTMNGVNSQIKPSLVKGAKAWHLRNSQSNNFKTCFQNAIKTGLDHYEFVLLSFGEIDCRQDDGILKYCLKNKASVEATSQSTAKGYVRWIASELLSYRKKLILLGIPAAQKLKTADSPNADEINSRRLSVIHSFNKALSEECLGLGIVFADVLQLTSDKDGFNNGNWMIDNVHLKPKAIQEIISHYLIQPSHQ